jgi:2-oxoglutarate ferredoxin oxidoreductase subunit delta
MDETLNKRGVHPATFTGQPEDCTGCANCAVICPDTAIEIEEVPDDE